MKHKSIVENVAKIIFTVCAVVMANICGERKKRAVSVANTTGFIVNSVTAASTLHTILFAFFFINLIIFPPIYCSISYEIVKLLPSKLTSAMLPHTTGIIGDI